ncbi:hypothetical protein D9M68_657850 [compost metagenome]
MTSTPASATSIRSSSGTTPWKPTSTSPATGWAASRPAGWRWATPVAMPLPCWDAWWCSANRSVVAWGIRPAASSASRRSSGRTLIPTWPIWMSVIFSAAAPTARPTKRKWPSWMSRPRARPWWVFPPPSSPPASSSTALRRPRPPYCSRVNRGWARSCSRAPCTRPARVTIRRWWRSTVRRCRKPCWRRNSSVWSAAPSPEPTVPAPDDSNGQKAAPCSSTRSPP